MALPGADTHTHGDSDRTNSYGRTYLAVRITIRLEVDNVGVKSGQALFGGSRSDPHEAEKLPCSVCFFVHGWMVCLAGRRLVVPEYA